MSEGTRELADELMVFVKHQLSKHEHPREIEWCDALPMSTTGKIRRKVLKDLEIERAKTAAVAAAKRS